MVREQSLISDGGMYVGEWENRKYHGHGTFTYPDRTRYKWEYNNMYEQDQEIPIFCLLNKYVGDWKEGENTVKGHTNLVGEWN